MMGVVKGHSSEVLFLVHCSAHWTVIRSGPMPAELFFTVVVSIQGFW